MMGDPLTPRGPLRRITPEVLDTFKKAKAIMDSGEWALWEAEGGRRREAMELCARLNAALRRRPWQFDIMFASEIPAPDWMTDWQRRLDYGRAHNIHRQLVEAAEARRR
jgi:hypothetical protein